MNRRFRIKLIASLGRRVIAVYTTTIEDAYGISGSISKECKIVFTHNPKSAPRAWWLNSKWGNLGR
jgi:hypothetical protein